MKPILDFIRQELNEPDYYIGTVFWAAASLLADFAKMKKNAIDSGLASLDDRYIVSIYNWSTLLAFGIAFIFLLRIWKKLREPFTTYHPTLWQYGLSWTWMSIRATIIVFLGFVPGMIYSIANYAQLVENPLRIIPIMAVNLILITPLCFVVFYGASALLIARGKSRRSIRDGIRSLPHIWKEALLTIGLAAVPMIVLLPLRLLSFKFPPIELIAIGLSACFAPYSFGVLGATYLYLGKVLIEKAPALVAGPEAATSSAQ